MDFYRVCLLSVQLLLDFRIISATVTIQVPSAGNCGDDTVLTCQVTGNIGNTGWYGLNRSLVIKGVIARPEDNNKYTETRGTSSFTLTIHNTDITDGGDYRCKNGFIESQTKSLNIECKASSSTYSVSRGKKVQITVDRLYPASPTITATFNRQNNAIQISGSSTCSSSTQYTGYYRCVWTSRNSLYDGSYTYSIVVTTITQATPLTGSFKIASPHTPLISNVVQLNASREVVYGNEGQTLTIQCTSTGGSPSPTVTWYKNSISSSNQLASTSSGTLQSDGTYTVTLQHTFTPATSDDREYLICRSYFPQADSAQVGSNNKSVLLYLTLKPNQPIVTQTSVVSAGSTVTVRCTTSGCRPAASISWVYQGVTYSGSTTSTPDAATETFTVVSIYTKQVTAANNGQSIQCIVTHPAFISPAQLTKSTNLNVQFSVGPSTTQITGNREIIATGSTPLTLTCTTGSSNPASDITWRNGSQTLESNRPYTTSTGENNGVVKSQQLVLYPTRYMDGDDITCSVSNNVSQSPVVDKIKMDLKYRPLVKPMSDVIVVEGNYTELICAASSKPASTFKWYKQGQTKVLHNGTGTSENNKLSYPLTNVRRGDAATYTCNANNGIENADSKNVLLTVYYPPEMSVTTTNTTINAISVVLTCNANGVPDNNYIYGKWVQSWPGIDVPVSQHHGSEKLELKDLTYEHSGVYSCSASNGINLFGTTQTFMEGSVNLLVKSFPIFVKVDEIIAGSLNSNTTVVVKYYSNVEETSVKIYKHEGNEKNKDIIYRVNEFPIEVELPVFEHDIKTRGIEASIVIQLNSHEDFGYYFLVVSNEIGSSNISFQIRMEGPPNKPVDITVDYIKYNEARLSWIRGFHGGLKQTFVLQLSNDWETWRDINVYDGIVDNSEKVTKLITDLKDSTTYHVRMYAFNNAGNSPLTATVNFTTPTIKRENDGQTKDYSTMTVGIVLGCCLVALAIYAIYVTVELRKTQAISQRKDLSTEAGRITYTNMANVSNVIKQDDDTNNENQYTELKRDVKVESAYETLTSM